MRCELCGCQLPASEASRQQHEEGMQHKRRLLASTKLNLPGGTALSLFEDAAVASSKQKRRRDEHMPSVAGQTNDGTARRARARPDLTKHRALLRLIAEVAGMSDYSRVLRRLQAQLEDALPHVVAEMQETQVQAVPAPANASGAAHSHRKRVHGNAGGGIQRQLRSAATEATLPLPAAPAGRAAEQLDLLVAQDCAIGAAAPLPGLPTQAMQPPGMQLDSAPLAVAGMHAAAPANLGVQTMEWRDVLASFSMH